MVCCKCLITELVLFGYMKAHLHTLQGAQSSNSRQGPQISHLWGAQRQEGRWEPESSAPEEWATLPWLSQGCPRRASARAEHETPHQQPSGAPRVTLLTVAKGWGTCGWRERAAWDAIGFIMGCLGRNKKHKKGVGVIWEGLEVEKWKGAKRAG